MKKFLIKLLAFQKGKQKVGFFAEAYTRKSNKETRYGVRFGVDMTNTKRD